LNKEIIIQIITNYTNNWKIEKKSGREGDKNKEKSQKAKKARVKEEKNVEHFLTR